MPPDSLASTPDATSVFCTRRCQWVFSGLLLLLGLGLTVLIATRLQDHEQLLARTQFEHLAQARLARLHERLDERVRDLESVRYFMERLAGGRPARVPPLHCAAAARQSGAGLGAAPGSFRE